LASGGSTLAVLTLTACANGLLRMVCARPVSSGDHFRGLRCMPRPAAYARKSDRAFPLGTSIPQQVKGQGFVTSSRATRTTWRSNVEQVWPPCRPLHFTNPSPIIPKHPPHTAHVRMAPSTPADSRGSCATVHRLRLILWRRVDEQHRPKTSSIFMRAGAKPWVVLGVVLPPFPAGAEPVYSSRYRFICSRPRRTGPRGVVRFRDGRITY
jgi:hypothetical protein